MIGLSTGFMLQTCNDFIGIFKFKKNNDVKVNKKAS